MIPMNQRIYYSDTVQTDTDGRLLTDEFGRPITEAVEKETKARVMYRTIRIERSDGTYFTASVVIDIPPGIIIVKDAKIRFKDMHGDIHDGVVIEVEDIPNVSGSRTMYRSLMVDG